MSGGKVPFFRPDIGEREVEEVVATLRSGWLTTGPRVQKFEREFCIALGAKHAVAVNSCTAALHLAVEALGVGPGEAVLVPTFTFAATAEVVRYQGAFPILVDCEPDTQNLDLEDAARKAGALSAGGLPAAIPCAARVVGVIAVHVGGLMMNMAALRSLAEDRGWWVVEDAAHAFPAAWRTTAAAPWQRCGEGTASVTCYSFYANKTITTGEGGMAVTDDLDLAERMRLMSLHGLSRDAWGRYSGGGSWDYRIIAPGYKYNLTDLAAAIGIHQLARAEEMRREREAVASEYFERLAPIEEIELPPRPENRIHAWHLYPIRLRLETLGLDRDGFLEELKANGVGCSVHWRPLHMHTYYERTFGWRPEDFPVATSLWRRLVSLPIFSGMRREEIDHVVSTLAKLCTEHRKR